MGSFRGANEGFQSVSGFSEWILRDLEGFRSPYGRSQQVSKCLEILMRFRAFLDEISGGFRVVPEEFSDDCGDLRNIIVAYWRVTILDTNCFVAVAATSLVSNTFGNFRFVVLPPDSTG